MKSSKCELCLYRVKLGVLFIIGTAYLQGDYFEFSHQENLYFVQPKIDFKNCNFVKGMCVDEMYQSANFMRLKC